MVVEMSHSSSFSKNDMKALILAHLSLSYDKTTPMLSPISYKEMNSVFKHKLVLQPSTLRSQTPGPVSIPRPGAP